MRKRFRAVTFAATLFGGLACSVAPAQAPQPSVIHATTSTADGSRGLKAVIDTAQTNSQPVWIGYDIPVLHPFSSYGERIRVAHLEEDHYVHHEDEKDEHVIADRSFDHATLLLRISEGAVRRVRFEPPDRELDAGGRPFVWVTGVKQAESIRELTALATAPASSRDLRDAAVFAISQHASPAATQSLIAIMAPTQARELRQKAAFWLAGARDQDGLTAVRASARNDVDADFRKELTFDLTLSKDPDALKELIRMAHEDSSPIVRKQAQFWMAAKGGKEIGADLRNAAERDPDAEVRKAAVFAMTQLPQPESTTQLIALADSSSDMAVRKQAVFWLGQSSDPRALDYLTKLLER